MRRRSSIGGRTKAPRRRNAPKAARPHKSLGVREESEVTRLRRELSEALERQAATSEVLQVISGSPGQLEPVFQAILENATRICEARAGHAFQFDGENFHTIAQIGTAPELVQFQRRRGSFQPVGSGFRHLMRSKQLAHTGSRHE